MMLIEMIMRRKKRGRRRMRRRIVWHSRPHHPRAKQTKSCVGCAAPYWAFGVWCQLAREPPSVWIATTRTSLPTSKWALVKNHFVIIWFQGDWSSLVFILVIDWFIPRLVGITILLTLSLHYHKLVVKLFSVASHESLLVWLVWLLVSLWEHTNLV